jgi:hypothetical protein
MLKALYCLLFFSPFVSFAQDRIIQGTLRQALVWTDSDTVESVIEYAYFQPAHDPAERAVNEEIHERHELWLDDSTRVSAPLSEAFFHGLLNDFIKFATAEPDQYNIPWQLEMATHITPYKDFVQVSVAGYEYAGGVHGNGSFDVMLYARTDGHRIRLDEIFSDVEAVTARFEKVFRETVGLEPEDPLNENEFWFRDNVFALNDNYFLRENEFVVYYNTYEISSYAMGPIEIAMPLEELKDYLKLQF